MKAIWNHSEIEDVAQSGTSVSLKRHGSNVQIDMQDIQFCLGEWPCGSWDITVASKSLQIADTRKSLPIGLQAIYIVQIGDSEAFGASMPRLHSTMWHSRSRKVAVPVTRKSMTRSSLKWDKVGYLVAPSLLPKLLHT